MANANSQGSLAGLKQAAATGLGVKKRWLTAGSLGRICERCRRNEAAGPIDLDQAFPSGDMAPTAHPHCRCALVPVVDVDAAKFHENAGDEMAHRYESPEDREFRGAFHRHFGASAVEREFDDACAEFHATEPTRRDKTLVKTMSPAQIRKAKLTRYLAASEKMLAHVERRVDIQAERLAPHQPTKRISQCH